MKLNPCSKCKCTTQQLITPSPYRYQCAFCGKTTKTSYLTVAEAAAAWNSTNPNTLALAACKSLMQRYGVDGKMAEADLPDYDRRLAHMLVDEGVLSLANGLYQQK